MPFRESSAVSREFTTGVFEPGMLPDAEKERLCRSLLAEFGVTSVKVQEPKGELIHCCALPWHDEHDPSAGLNYKKLTYNCFGCGSSGGLLWFIATCRGEDSDQARRWLESETGTGADDQSLSSLLEFFEATYGPKNNHEAPMPKMSTRALEPWLAIHPYMTDPKPEGRGIPEATLMRFRVGYGVISIKLSESNWVQSHRIVIPHFVKGNLVGWQSRRIIKDGTPKYQSSGDMPKDRTIYNYNSEVTTGIVVESPMSVLSKFHVTPNMEATFGAEVNDKQVRLLSIHRRIILFMDNDDAGWRATERLIEALEPYCEVFVADSTWAADPADMDDDTYLALIEGAIPASLWQRPKELTPWPSSSISSSMTTA